jgi:hypothetical protein
MLWVPPFSSLLSYLPFNINCFFFFRDRLVRRLMLEYQHVSVSHYENAVENKQPFTAALLSHHFPNVFMRMDTNSVNCQWKCVDLLVSFAFGMFKRKQGGRKVEGQK